MIYILPGMGADSRMYSGSWRSLPETQFAKWPDFRGERTIEAVARRVIAELDIKTNTYLIGSSLDGMVACEIANLIPVSGLALIGSAKNKNEISALLRLLHPLASLTPFEFIQHAAGKVPSDLAQMFKDGQAEFMRAMCHAIFDWDGLDEECIKPLRIHGRHDRVIPNPAEVQHYLDGGHLVAMTHARECVEIIWSAWFPGEQPKSDG